jgi:Flp pilus assembly protein TadG
MKLWVRPIQAEIQPGADRLRVPHLRRRPRRNGTAVIEFAVGAGVLLTTFTGTFEFGYTLTEYNKLETAAAQGAHYAAIVPYDSLTTTPSAAFLSSVKNMVLYGSPVAGNSPVVSGLAAGNVVLKVSFANGVPSSMQVSITGYTINALFGTHTLTGKPQVTYSYQGLWAPV